MLNGNREQLLDDSFIVFKGFIYLVDNQPKRSPINGTVRKLKRKLSAREIRRYDIAGRRMLSLQVYAIGFSSWFMISIAYGLSGSVRLISKAI